VRVTVLVFMLFSNLCLETKMRSRLIGICRTSEET